MEYTITPSGDGKYIILKVKGNITRQSAMQMNMEAHAVGKSMGIKRYLVDVTEARNVDTDTSTYAFAHLDMRSVEGIDRTARVATLVSPGDHTHDFVETVSMNAGLDVVFFTDLEAAKRYLLGDFPPQPEASVGQ